MLKVDVVFKAKICKLKKIALCINPDIFLCWFTSPFVKGIKLKWTLKDKVASKHFLSFIIQDNQTIIKCLKENEKLYIEMMNWYCEMVIWNWKVIFNCTDRGTTHRNKFENRISGLGRSNISK